MGFYNPHTIGLNHGPNPKKVTKRKGSGLRKYPRPPKKNASFSTLQNWHRKCAEVDQFNKGKLAELNAAVKLQEAVEKRVSQIRSMGGKFNRKPKSK